MSRTLCRTTLALVLLAALAVPASAQVTVTTYTVARPRVSYYYTPATVSYYTAPAVPVVSYYTAPAPVVSYYTAPAPVVSYYTAPAPVVSYYTAPAPVVSYYTAPVVSYYTAPVAATTYRYGLFGRRSVTTYYYYP